MNWNTHHYYTARDSGLYSKLRLNDSAKQSLEQLRGVVRSRIKEIFEEAKILAKESEEKNLSLEVIHERLMNTKFKHLDNEARNDLANLFKEMEPKARESFLQLTPRFWTQGSFQYDTLNQPYIVPPQEMDIDDGTYLPMEVFEGTPVVGHRLLLLLVDTALCSLANENLSWYFEAKRTCGRIKIPSHNTHIDVPMYAVPREEFFKKVEATARINEHRALFGESEPLEDERASFKLDPDNVNLALREGDQKWCKSDPKIVADWFNDECTYYGRHLKKICRFIKAWRDVHWEKGGPSSITLMAAVVEAFRSTKIEPSDLGAGMIAVTEKLPEIFERGIESPDHTDEKLLFPPTPEDPEFKASVITKLRELHQNLYYAQSAESKTEAFNYLAKAFGNRVTDDDLIVRSEAAPAFEADPEVTSKPKKISNTLSSGYQDIA
ncbi:MAG: CBASS cGAMP synthase [Idiomarina sp.]